MNEITFMQVRIIRLALEYWNLPIEKIMEIFKAGKVLEYIETGYGIFHCEGDEAVFEDVECMLERKGLKPISTFE